jgi:hypothetical protein
MDSEPTIRDLLGQLHSRMDRQDQDRNPHAARTAGARTARSLTHSE